MAEYYEEAKGNNNFLTITLTCEGGEARLAVDKINECLTYLPEGNTHLSLHTLVEQIFRNNVHDKRLANNMNWLSTGQSGEANLVTYYHMEWQDAFNCVATGWFQHKTLKIHLTTWVADYNCPEAYV